MAHSNWQKMCISNSILKKCDEDFCQNGEGIVIEKHTIKLFTFKVQAQRIFLLIREISKGGKEDLLDK